MPKVVKGTDFDKFVQTGEHQTIDAGSKRVPDAVPTPKPAAVIAEIAKAEAATAAEMQPEADRDDGLEAEDHDLAERAQKRISKKHREMKQADALAKKLREELEDSETFSKTQYSRAVAAEEDAAKLRAELANIQAKTPKVDPGAALIPPDENAPQFRNDKGEFQLKVYEKARDEYLKAQFREELRQEQAAEQRRRADEAWALKQKAFAAQLEQIREKYPDFQAKAAKLDIIVPPYIQSFMVKSPYGGEFGNYFVNNVDVLERLKSMDPDEALAEMGEIQTRWKTKTETKTETGKTLAEIIPITRASAPAPIQPLSGAGSPGVNSDPAKMSPKELLAYTREKEIAKKHKRG